MSAIPKPRPGGIVRFGKRKAKRDGRNLMFAMLLKPPPALPAEYDFDVAHNGIPTPMFGNDQYGDCVMAGRAHQTLRFEKAEQNKLIAITDNDVLHEYFSESGGADSGLVVLDSLKEWRSTGWIAAKRRYKIKAFAEIDRGKNTEVKRAVFMDIGLGLGLTLPDSAMPQFYAGKPWSVVGGKAGKPNPNSGHYVYVPGYTTSGPVCVTWGRKQQMSWAFFAKYCDEAYAIIDAIDTAKKKRALDAGKLDAFLAALRKPKPKPAKKPAPRAGARHG
ncbi:MAG TPA: hypothetical protein VFE77_17915 [Rhodanobacter sp.]|nr:hypothetical protein [Rhodanobacter sp.]